MRYLIYSAWVLIVFWSLSSCNRTDKRSDTSPLSKDSLVPSGTPDTIPINVGSNSDASGSISEELSAPDTSELEHNLIAQGLVDILQKDPGIETDIKYSTTDNFLHEDVYEDFDKCYLQPEVADMLLKAQKVIKEKDSALSLIVFDCVRPRAVQHKMWKIVKGTPQQPYVAPPGGIGSMHNYGAAVDLGLIHRDSGLVDMGTPFDFFGPKAQPRYEMDYLKKGELSQAQLQNRWLLRNAMKAAGFEVILSEWWHFNAFPAEVVRKRFVIVE